MRKRFLAPAVLLSLATLVGIISCDDVETPLQSNLGRGGVAGQSGGQGGQGESGQGGEGISGQGGKAGQSAAEIQIPGLQGKVDATYDEYGFLHLTCDNDEDCSLAMGYFHAANRFFFMDFIRHLVRGQLGSIVKAGDTVLDLDYENRRFFATPEGKPLEDTFIEQADEQTKKAMTAYAQGVNAWIADMKAERNGASLTEEYKFALLVHDTIRPWEPQDSAAVGLYMLRDLSETGSGEIYLGNTLGKLSAGLGADLLSLRPLYDAYTLTSSGEAGVPGVPIPQAQTGWFPLVPETQKHLSNWGPILSKALGHYDVEAMGHQRAKGSNNWVLSPGRTTAKKGLLCNDPHLQLSNPSVWFPIEVDGKTRGTGSYHVAGGSFPGLPLVLTGQNEDLAWGVTVIYYDLTDVYIEELSEDGKKVKFKGQEVPIVEKEFSFKNAVSGEFVKKTLRWVPHHGPIVSEDLEKKQAVTVRWVAHQGSSDLQGFFSLGRAKTVAEAREALKHITSANQNFIVVDRKGDIGWFPFGKVPRRPWASAKLPPWLPLPGDGSAEWDGFVDIDKLPQMINPPAGFIATANQEMSGASADGDPTNDGQEALQSWEKADGTRMKRIVDLIKAGGHEHTPESLLAIQGDTHILIAEPMVPAMLKAAENSKDAGVQLVASALKDWKFTCPTGLDGEKKDSPKSADPELTRESIGCSAFHITLYALNAAALDDELKAAGASVGSVNRADMLSRALGRPETLLGGEEFWDDISTTDKIETRDDILVASMKKAAENLSKIGDDKDDWRWGRIHTLTLRSIFDNFGVSTYNFGPMATPGGFSSVNVATPSVFNGPNLSYKSGPSLRTLIEVDAAGPKMKFQFPGGSDLHRKSAFYNNMVPRWLKNEPVPFAFGAVMNPAQKITLTPTP